MVKYYKNVSRQKSPRMLDESAYPALLVSGVPMRQAGFKPNDQVEIDYLFEKIIIKKCLEI